MKKFNIYSSIITAFTLIAIICLIIMIIYPAPIKPIIRTWIKSSNYPLSADAQNYGNYVMYNDSNASEVKTENTSDDGIMNAAAPNDSTSSNNDDTTSSDDSNEREDLRIANVNTTHNKILSLNRANVVLNAQTQSTSAENTALNDSTQLADERRNLIVFFIGGSFLFQDLTSHYGIGNKLYELMGPKKIDVMLMRYPVRFASTVQQSMLSINKTLSDVMLKYKEFYAIGYSAGSLLASVFIQKELDADYSSKIKVPQIGLSFKKFIGVCGLYYPVFMNNTMLTKLFRYYILRSTVNPSMYTVTSLMESIPKLVISNTTDFLYAQTAKFIQTTPNTAYKIYTNTKLNHTFIENVDLAESKDAFELIQKFILQPTN